jgi:trimethylamine--corrinoid protein Co-methyltransferase
MPKRGPKGGLLRLLSKGEVNEIHTASLEVLERVGVRTQSEAILKVFLEFGADADPKEKIVRIPEHLIEEAMRKAPSEIVLSGRNSRFDILLEGQRVYYVLGGSPVPYTVDLETGEWVASTKRHVAMATQLGDALPNMDVIMSLGGASDVPGEVSWLHELATMLENTEKPIAYSAAGAEGARYALSMGAAIVGGHENLKRKHIITLFSSFTTPLQMGVQQENIIEFAKANAPVICHSGMMVAASTPITQAGASVLGNAEFLCAASLAQLVNPGTPVIYSAEHSNIDVRTGMALYGTPERGTGFVVNSQMADFYGVPTFGAGGTTDAKCIDTQAGLEAMGTAMICALGGVNLIHNCGTIGGGSAGSLEMAVISDEIANYVNRFLQGVHVDDERLAVDLIAKVGPGGHYLAEEHTRRYLREGEYWMSELLDRESVANWKKAGGRTLAEVAREKARRILREHHTPSPSSESQKQIASILRQAEKSLVPQRSSETRP